MSITAPIRYLGYLSETDLDWRGSAREVGAERLWTSSAISRNAFLSASTCMASSRIATEFGVVDSSGCPHSSCWLPVAGTSLSTRSIKASVKDSTGTPPIVRGRKRITRETSPRDERSDGVQNRFKLRIAA